MSSPRQILDGIISFDKKEKKWPTLRQEEASQQYRHSALGGAAGGAIMGRVLHSKGALPGIAIGALTGIGARAALSPTVDALEDKGLPIDAGIVGRLPAAAMLGAGAATYANREKLFTHAAKLGEKYRLARMKRVTRRVAGLLTYAEQLRDIIQFEYEEAPRGAHGWNPFKWKKQQKELDRFVRRKEDENPVPYHDVKSQYKPVKGAGRIAVGGLLGGLAASGATMAYGLKGKGRIAQRIMSNKAAMRGAIGAAFTGGSLVGAYAGDRKELNNIMHRHRAGLQTVRNEVETNRVPVSTIKSEIPIASTHMETARALKGEGVGFFRRHTMGLATHGIRHSKENAAFIPAGKRGIIVSPKEQSPLVIRHEEGHAKDYAHYGGERGWDRRTSEPAVHPNRDAYIHETMAPEHRAWHHAGPLSENEKKVRDAALETYAAGGMLRRTKNFSAREALDSILNFNSITYHETEAEMRTRKARSNREKSSTGLAAAGLLGTGAALATTNPTIATAGRKGMSDLGGWMMSKDPARIRDASGIARSGAIGRIGTAIARNPAGAFRVAAAAPPILAAGYALAHTAASWRNDRKANDSYEKANIMRRARNSQMQSLLADRMRQPVAMSARDELSRIINFARGGWQAIPVRGETDIAGQRGRIEYARAPQPGVMGHLKRNAGTYGLGGTGALGGLVLTKELGMRSLPLGIAAGATAVVAGALSGRALDKSRGHRNAMKSAMARAPYDILQAQSVASRARAAILAKKLQSQQMSACEQLDGIINFGIFSPGTAKRVFRGLAEGAEKSPLIRPGAIGMGPAFIARSTPSEVIGAAAEMYGSPKIMAGATIVPKLSDTAKADLLVKLPPDRAKAIGGIMNDPVAAAAHERGHAYDPLVEARQGNQMRRADSFSQAQEYEGAGTQKKIGKNLAAGMLQHEEVANRRVLGQVEKYGKPEEVDAWKKYANNQMKVGYRKPMFDEATQGQSLTQKKDFLRDNPYLRRQATALEARSKALFFNTSNSAGISNRLSAREELEVIQLARGDKLRALIPNMPVEYNDIGKAITRRHQGDQWGASQMLREKLGRKLPQFTKQGKENLAKYNITHGLSARDQLNTILLGGIHIPLKDAGRITGPGAALLGGGAIAAALAAGVTGHHLGKKDGEKKERIRQIARSLAANPEYMKAYMASKQRQMSARGELNLITLGVDANGKLHNSKGEFGGDNDAVAHPTAMRMTYGKALGIAATTGTAGGIAGVSAKALLEKLKQFRKK